MGEHGPLFQDTFGEEQRVIGDAGSLGAVVILRNRRSGNCARMCGMPRGCICNRYGGAWSRCADAIGAWQLPSKTPAKAALSKTVPIGAASRSAANPMRSLPNS